MTFYFINIFCKYLLFFIWNLCNTVKCTCFSQGSVCTLPSVWSVISSDMSRAVTARGRAPGTEIHPVTAQHAQDEPWPYIISVFSKININPHNRLSTNLANKTLEEKDMHCLLKWRKEASQQKQGLIIWYKKMSSQLKHCTVYDPSHSCRNLLSNYPDWFNTHSVIKSYSQKMNE